jgi:3-isopropylmalate/(R)-2-methylmalate dehydratase small subunit
MTRYKGRVFKYGDNVNTDVIFPGKYTYTVTDRREMAKHALEDLDPEFIQTVKPGDIIVAGKNFGCGSSREQAVTCVKEAGVAVVIAVSFARIYFRNCINEGLPALVCPAAVEAIQNGESVEVDLAAGTIATAKGTFAFPPFPPAVQAILSAGGLIPYLKSI